ncbi:ABC transporter substrate-binding protein [Xenophilus sp. Marseille-Q4582]|uniref:ABC transporter substrate-binding protein n=1 Tax=Xenophilus sp. Marseille-Q4582 TaxID=2866600 RepID=UPI001CE4463A|nr:ABC transporter substrate-binding protein [Xenophilus sp. Marseille-Q4582]
MTLPSPTQPMPVLRRRQLMAGLGATALAGAWPFAPAWAQRGKFGNAECGIASIDPLYAMVYVGAKNGYFADAGLNLKPMNAQSGPRAKQMLAAGQIFAAVSGVNDAVSLTLAGKQAVLVGGFDTRIPFANILISKKLYDSGVRDIQGLAGRSIGITQPQSATWLMAVYLSDRAGIKDKVQIRPLGDFATMLGAVKSGSVDCCTATYSMLNKAQAEGWGVPLFDVTDTAKWNTAFGGDIPGVGIYVMKDSIDKRPEAVQALVTGLSRATDYLHKTSAEEVVALIGAEYLQGYERQLSIDAVTNFKKVWSPDNLIGPQHYERLMAVMGDGRQMSAEDAARVPYANMVDMRFVKAARGLA